MRNSRRTLIVLAVAVTLAVLALAGCGGNGDTPGYNAPGTGDGTSGGATNGDGTSGTGDNTVVAQGFAFSPDTLEVSVGDTVTFTNEDSAIHDVEIEGENLGTFGQGESLTWTADAAGTYSYLCTIHPSMTGEIVVK